MSAHELALAEELASYQDDPIGFAADVLNLELDLWQCRFLEAVREYQRVAVRSSTGQGKDFIAAAAVLWFWSSYDRALCPCTANNQDQLEKVLWKQFAELIGGSNGLDAIADYQATTIRHRQHPAEWLIFAKTSAKKVSSGGEKHAEGSAGHHAENMIVLLDEGSGIEEEFWQAYEPTITGPNNKLVAIGNPNRLSGSFYQIWFNAKVGGFWKRFTIAGKPSPRGAAALSSGDEYFVSDRGNQSGNHDYLLSKWGANHPIVQSKVFGVHPTISDVDTGFAYEEVMAAMVPGRIQESAEDDVQIGNDVARFGDDETTYWIRRGRKFRFEVERKQTTTHIADRLLELSEEEPDATDPNGEPLIVIDETGVGGGVVDSVHEKARAKGRKVRIRAVTFGSQARDPKAYTNLAAEMWLCDLKEYFRCMACARFYEAHLDDGAQPCKYNPGIEMPYDEETLHQLIRRKFRFTGKGDGRAKRIGQRALQPKDEMRKLGLGSPDRADGLCLSVVRPRVARIL